VRRISYKNMPPRLLLTPMVLAAFLLDYYKAPGWAWGIWGTISVLDLMMWLHALATSKSTDLFERHKK